MAAVFRLFCFYNLIVFVSSSYCHAESRSCSDRRVLRKIEVNDPEHCKQLCDHYKGNACRAMEYFKGICTMLKESCSFLRLIRSPNVHYYYRPEKNGCRENNSIEHTNLAKGLPAYQSDTESRTLPIGLASLAVDGNNDPDYTKRSCTQTKAERSPYWFVNLKKKRKVTSVAITNRNDALGRHLKDFVIVVTKKRPKRNYRPSIDEVCIYRNETVRAEMGFVCDKPLEGRYVMVKLLSQAGVRRVLSLCEVEIFGGIAPLGFIDGDAFDLARGRKAYQINTAGIPEKPAYLAVNGNPERNLTRGHCSATDWIPNPWWAVDLGGRFLIKGVRLTNRNDCCADRLSSILIAVTRSLPRVGEHYIPTSEEECSLRKKIVYEPTYVECQKPLKGRFVIIILAGSYLENRQLSLCEVNVYAKY